jgi:hypothetical protein
MNITKIGKIKKISYINVLKRQYHSKLNFVVYKVIHNLKIFRNSFVKILLIIFVFTLVGVTYNEFRNKINIRDFTKVLANQPIVNFELARYNNLTNNTQNLSNFSLVYTPTSSLGLIDKRAWVLDEYFKTWNSPLFGYGKNFVEACDKYGSPRDCVMVAAVAANESHLCTYIMSWEMKNCWGYGGGGVHRWTFPTIEEAIDTVTMLITKTYGIEFMNNPSLYELTFCGTSEPECWGWGKAIIFFMNQIRNFALERGVDMSK